MALKLQLLEARVTHKRLGPKTNTFGYPVFYLVFPLSFIENGYLNQVVKVNRWGPASFHLTDHGKRDGSSLEVWAREILGNGKPGPEISTITLVCMPRIFGYGFNPVSFWLCRDSKDQLRAVIAEVNNTFGETHTYLCAHENQRPIKESDWLEANKVFHVSPFLERNGNYKFNFIDNDEYLSFTIDYYDANGSLRLATNLTGSLSELNKTTLRSAFLKRPFLTFKVIALIHYQALKLLVKGFKHISKPKQLSRKNSKTN